MDRIQAVSIVGSALLLLLVLELVRRRRFLERYAILWLFAASLLLALGIWRDALERIAELFGIAAPENAFFLVAFGFTLVLLLHFSLAVSKLADQNRVLAQRAALLEERQRELEKGEGEQADHRAVAR